jgi:hypothetical protein
VEKITQNHLRLPKRTPNTMLKLFIPDYQQIQTKSYRGNDVRIAARINEEFERIGIYIIEDSSLVK